MLSLTAFMGGRGGVLLLPSCHCLLHTHTPACTPATLHTPYLYSSSYHVKCLMEGRLLSHTLAFTFPTSHTTPGPPHLPIPLPCPTTQMDTGPTHPSPSGPCSLSHTYSLPSFSPFILILWDRPALGTRRPYPGVSAACAFHLTFLNNIHQFMSFLAATTTVGGGVDSQFFYVRAAAYYAF